MQTSDIQFTSGDALCRYWFAGTPPLSPCVISAAILASSDPPSLWQSPAEPLFCGGQFARHDIEEIESERGQDQGIPEVMGRAMPVASHLEQLRERFGPICHMQ